jgi:hypothetical protein
MSFAPPLAPASDDQQTVYLVLDNFGGRLGRSWRETDEGKTDLAALMVDLVDGQYNDPVRVVASTRLRAGRATRRGRSPI